MSRLTGCIFWAGVLAIVIGPIRFDSERVRVIPGIRIDKPAIDGIGKFAPLAVYSTTDDRDLPAGLRTRGSWLGSDSFQGSYLTDWFQARPKMTVLLAGYPALSPNRLEVEVRRRTGSSTLVFSGVNPAESWQPWTIALPSDAVAARIRAVDGKNDLQGWLAFSEPFIMEAGSLTTLWPFLQIATAMALAITLLYGPGLLWYSWRRRDMSDLGLAIGVGPLLLVLTGLICWALGGWIPPARIARISVGLILAGLAVLGWRTRTTRIPLPRPVAIVAGIGILLVGFAAAKANVSHAAPGELYQGTVSRTLEVGWTSDSRIPYQVLQLVAHHSAPYGPQSVGYFSPWSFASRGPLAGLLAAPIVLATGAEVPITQPNQAWHPFDRQGFVVYRLTLIVLASLAGWALFAAAAAVMDSSWALLAASIGFMAPFFVHEMYFTWPKLMAASGVISSFVQIRKSRPCFAGAILGIGYLFHPSAILAAPFLALWFFAGYPKTWFRAGARFGAGLAIPVVAWLAVGSLRPANEAGQEVFLKYFVLAENQPATWQSWRYTRWENFSNTFIPFHLLSKDNFSLNSAYGHSDAWVHFGFLYWNTLPFALGLPVFVILGLAIVVTCRRAPALAFATVVGPAALMVIYWGWEVTGLMRDCGHWLFFSFIILGVWTLRQSEGRWRTGAILALTSPILLALRGLDIGWMAFGATLHNHWPDLAAPFGLNDRISLVLAGSCLAAVVIWLSRLLILLRRQLGLRP